MNVRYKVQMLSSLIKRRNDRYPHKYSKIPKSRDGGGSYGVSRSVGSVKLNVEFVQ